jgi:type IV secretion system protein VirD4
MDLETFAYLGLGVSTLGLASWRMKKSPTTYGSAEWLQPWVASRKGMFKKGDGSLLIGDWTGQLPVYYRGSGHALTVAPNGRGKGTTAIIPNLLRYPWIFLIDPGGENTAVAAKAWRAKGYAFSCLNPWGMHTAAPWSLPSHSINPLSILDPASLTFVSDADLLADMIVTRAGSESSSSVFFKEEARSGIRAFLMHIATTEPDERRTLTTLRKYITAEADSWGTLIEAMKVNTGGSGAIAREAAQMERREAQAPEEFSAVLSTMKQDTNFIEDPIMQAALASSTVDLSELKGYRGSEKLKGAVLSVVIPLPYLDTHAAYARLIVGCALWTMQRAPLSRGRVLFVMDEFAAMKRIDRIANGIATLRKYRVWLWPILQNIGQLKQLYGQNWQTFISNAGLKTFIGANDLETAQYVSDICGEGTIEVKTRSAGGGSVSHAARRLATAEEVMRSSNTQQIVFADNLKPLLLRNTPYWERPGLRGKFNSNPYVNGTPALGASFPFQLAKGWGVRFCAWLVGPSPAVTATILFALATWSHLGICVGQDTARARTTCLYLQTDGVKRGHLRSQQSISCPPIIFVKL